MMVGDILKYMPTSTVGKVMDIRDRDGRVWAQLDRTNLYYDVTFLTPADPSEYKEVSYKEREKNPVGDRERTGRTLQELHQMEEDVDIRDLTPSGGG
ncbi:MAG: DUF2098 domain-containing protein [Candidatus Methanoplasma sp.]|jgi:hypothetical protein|nr:DUF2098 domain-containing protein [Candidatus Methanoplasma sp.]